MSQSKIEIFAQMAREQPDNEMIWYGLANEYGKAGRWSEAADALRNLILINLNYTAAYQLLGTALMNQGDRAGACRAWEQGIEVADRTGACKARQHMESLLAGTDVEPGSEFCQ
jgi:predicted Zn-dependent protease